VVLRNYSNYHINVDVLEDDGYKWRFTGIYGYPQTEDRHKTWTLLRDLHSQEAMPWLCAGDFNEILYQHEKEGGALRPQSQMDRFREAIVDCDLQDLGFEGDVYTWRNNNRTAQGYVRERLAALANMDWRAKFTTVHVLNGDPRHSDHRPVIISMEREATGPVRGSKAFFFEAVWLEEQCAEVVKEAWDQGVAEGLTRVDQLVGRVAGSLSCWSSNVLGGWEKRRKKLKKGVGGM